MYSSLNWRCTITSLDCDVRFEWDELRDWVLRSSFPTLLHEVRADIVKHLAKGGDTLYSISKAIGRPIQSVMKALKVLTEKGYVVCEREKSKRRKNVEANVCGLTELGKLAAQALADDIIVGFPIENPFYGDLARIISDRWIRNEKLRNVYREALMILMAHFNLENVYQDLLKEGHRPTAIMVGSAALIVAAQAKVALFRLFEEFLKKSRELPLIISFKRTIFEVAIESLEDKLEQLVKCGDREVREILNETVRVYLRIETPLIFLDYFHRLLFLGSLEVDVRNSEKIERLKKLTKELSSINDKIYEELGLSGLSELLWGNETSNSNT